MRRFAASLALAAGLMAAPALAHADWAWTRWDMSSDQVIKASKGKVASVPPRPGARVHGWELMAEGGMKQDGFDFKGEFFFDPSGAQLKVVRLTLNDPGQCEALAGKLAARFGPAVDTTTPMGALKLRTMVWADDGAGNFLGLTSLNAVGDNPPLCFIRYRPLGYADAPK